jgi:hypothetical protein
MEKQHRHAAAVPPSVRRAETVDRLTYTRAQAAEALGVSQSTLKRLLPYIELVELPWGAKLIPADELTRLVGERRRPPGKRKSHGRSTGRPVVVSADLVDRILAERAAGTSLAQIARDLNAEGAPTAHGGRQWWPSTVRAILVRMGPPETAEAGVSESVRESSDP